MDALSQPLAIVMLAMLCTLPLSAPVANAGQTAGQIDREVRDALQRDRDTRGIEFSVQASEVTLSGRVPTFWAKDLAIKRTLAVPGVETVASELEIPALEDDSEVAQDVARAIQRYPQYTIWDHIEGRINNGVVTLTGRVTPDWNKAEDLFERVAKVRGVQDVQSDIRTLSPSQGDLELRRAIALRVFRSPTFEHVATMRNPPFHIIVENSVVTLVGYVQSNIELNEIQVIIGQVQGILRLDNQLQALK